MHLPDRGGGKGAFVEVREHLRERRAELLTQEPLQTGERDRRDPVAERRELALQLVPLVLGQAIDLDHRDDLANLHRGTPHPAQLVDELTDERRGALLLGGRSSLRRTHAVGGPHPGPPNALPSHEPADSSRSRHATGWELLGVRGRILVLRPHEASVALRVRPPNRRGDPSRARRPTSVPTASARQRQNAPPPPGGWYRRPEKLAPALRRRGRRRRPPRSGRSVRRRGHPSGSAPTCARDLSPSCRAAGGGGLATSAPFRLDPAPGAMRPASPRSPPSGRRRYRLSFRPSASTRTGVHSGWAPRSKATRSAYEPFSVRSAEYLTHPLGAPAVRPSVGAQQTRRPARPRDRPARLASRAGSAR